MKAIILAAGEGTRLRPYTELLPKALIQLADRSLLEYQLCALKSLGIDDIAIVTGHRAECFNQFAIKKYYNENYKHQNMVASFFFADDFLTSDQDIIVSYGDIIYEPRVLKRLMDSCSPISLIADKNWLDLWKLRLSDPLEDAESFIVNTSNNIVKLGGIPDSYVDIQAQYIGLIKFSASSIKEIKDYYKQMSTNIYYDGQVFTKMYMTSFLQELIKNKAKIEAVFVNRGWLELDTVSDYKLYNKLLRNANYHKLGFSPLFFSE